MRLCAKCNEKGKLFNFDHCYNQKNKSIKFLNSENELKTWAECMSCKRFTGGFLKPVDAINQWNMGHIYNDEEYGDKLQKEYVGKIYSDEEISKFINQTEWDKYCIEIYFTNGDYERIFFDEYDSEFVSFDMSIYGKELNKLILEVLNYIKLRKLKVKEMKYNKN